MADALDKKIAAILDADSTFLALCGTTYVGDANQTRALPFCTVDVNDGDPEFMTSAAYFAEWIVTFFVHGETRASVVTALRRIKVLFDRAQDETTQLTVDEGVVESFQRRGDIGIEQIQQNPNRFEGTLVYSCRVNATQGA